MEHHSLHVPRNPPARKPPVNSRRGRPGVTMPELMVIIGIIVVLLAILLPALRAVRVQTLTTSSMNNMRQIATFMRAYERDNREMIVPSQFDYRNPEFTFKGRVRAPEMDGKPVDPATPGGPEGRHRGTWADILWTRGEVGVFPAAINSDGPNGVLGHDYRYDAPDRWLYEALGTVDNPFRAALHNTRDFRPSAGNAGNGVPKPYGDGAHERGYPGFFAANDFFDARPALVVEGKGAPEYDGEPAPATGRWWSTGQIRSPERSMYLIDSFVGEVISPEDEPFDNEADPLTGFRSIEVDFRYSNSALMLMLDGSIRPIGPWMANPGETVLEMLEERGIRIRQLDKRVPE